MNVYEIMITKNVFDEHRADKDTVEIVMPMLQVVAHNEKSAIALAAATMNPDDLDQDIEVKVRVFG